MDCVEYNTAIGTNYMYVDYLSKFENLQWPLHLMFKLCQQTMIQQLKITSKLCEQYYQISCYV